MSEAVEKMLAAARAQGVEVGAIALPKFTVEPRITLSLKKVPFVVALKYVTGLSNTAFKRVPGGFEIQQTPPPVPPGYVIVDAPECTRACGRARGGSWH